MKKEHYELAVELRRELHAHPELSHQESWTKARLMAFLKEHTGLEIVDRGPWFYARYRADSTKVPIALRADFDAIPVAEGDELPYHSRVPGVSHKCGHDGHSAALAATALEVECNGTDRDVYFIFQHAEEVGGGGESCAALLEENKIGRVYAFHSMTGYPRGAVCIRDGTMNCASMGMILSLMGVPAHASTPELGRSPALALAHLVEALDGLAKQAGKRGLALATVIQIAAGEEAFGVSAHQGRLLLTLRAHYEEELNTLRDAIVYLAQSESHRYGLACAVEYRDVFPETANDACCAGRVRQAAVKLGLPVVEMDEPMRASEDFGYYLKKAPGAMFLLGNGEDYAPIHSSAFDFLDEHIKTACAMFRALLGD